MTVSGGRLGEWAQNPSGERNSRVVPTDQAVVLPHLGEKFVITGRHAEGATCEVFKAHHVALDLAVAIKVLKREHAASPRFAERMRIEAQVLPRLKSRHIVQCFDRGITEDERPYTVLEFLRGETLEALLEKLGTFDELATIEVGCEIFEALATTHAHGIVHRDVSLRNLIVHHRELDPTELKLIDFGLAWITPDAPESAPEPARGSAVEDVIGTPRFTSPEIAIGRLDIDGRADLYSAGVVLYSLLAGHDPFFELDTPAAVLEAHANRQVRPIERVHRVSTELAAVVMRLLEKDRKNRFPTARTAVDALRSAERTIEERTRRRFSSSPSLEEKTFRTGDHCGPYVVKRMLDPGGIAQVYEVNAPDAGVRKPTALKILKTGVSLSEAARNRFLDEAGMLAKVRDPNVATIHQFGEHEGIPWIALELVKGTTLLQQAARGHSFPIPMCVKVAYGILGALRQIHRLELAHGNLSPRSVILTPSGEPCLLHALPTKVVSPNEQRSAVALLGSGAFVAPEVVAGGNPDAISDLFSWGRVIAEMLTVGRRGLRSPSTSTPVRSMILHRLHDHDDWRSCRAPEIPESLWELLLSATRDRRSLRPASVEDARAALDRACQGIPELEALCHLRTTLLEELAGNDARLRFINTRLILNTGVDLYAIPPTDDAATSKLQSTVLTLKKMGFLKRSKTGER
jgi:serine/threonine protein kinase